MEKDEKIKTEIKSGTEREDISEDRNTAGSEENRTLSDSSADTASPASKKKKTSKKKKKKKKSAGRLAADFFIKIGVTVLVLFVLLKFVFAIYVNHSHAAYPMVKDGDFCLVYRLTPLTEGDEVAYYADGEIKFGRIVAAGGDSVEIKGEVLMVNGYNITTDVVYPTTTEGSTIEYPYKVPADSYFILNDFRAEVTDSRVLGAIPKKDVRGKVIFIMRRRGI